MSEVLLLSMPYGKSYGRINIKDLGFGVPPIGLAYIASFLKSKSCDVRLVDLMFSTNGWEEAKKLIQRENPRWIGISATTTQINEAFMVASLAKEINPEVKVIIGGIHASALPEETIADDNIDILVYGEGEFTMWELVQNNDLVLIKGIYYKKGGQIIKNPPRDLVEDIDIFPYPLYEDLPIANYGTEYFGTTVGVISARGCPHQCIYCAANTIHKRRYRKRSTDSLIGEIEMLKNKYNIKRFSFYDDTFTLDKNRTIEICKALINRKIGLEWNCLTRCDALSRDMLKIMKEAGCKCIQIGIESGDDEILRLAKRRETVEDAIRAVGWVKELGIEALGFFIIGLPYDTGKTIQKTIDIAKKLKFDYAQFSILVPLPGSEVWGMAQEGKILELLSPDWENFGRYGKPIIRLKDVTSKELYRYFTKAYREFYLRPSYILGRLMSLRGIRDIKNLFKRSLALLKLLLK